MSILASLVVGFLLQFHTNAHLQFEIQNYKHAEPELIHVSYYHSIKFSGGPKAEVYAYTVTADNTTISRINLGEKLGVLQGTSYIDPDEESLVTNLGKKGSDDIEVVIKRKRNKGEILLVLALNKKYMHDLDDFSYDTL